MNIEFSSVNVKFPTSVSRITSIPKKVWGSDDFKLNSQQFYYPTSEYATIGTPGTQDFGVGKDTFGNVLYLEVIHTPSASIVNKQPSTATIALSDPYADPAATGIAFNGSALPLPLGTYSVGTPGTANFGIATRTSGAGAPSIFTTIIHTASLSIIASPPSTTPTILPDPYADPAATGFLVGGLSFPIPTPSTNYSIGTPGTTDFGIATNLSTSTAIIDPIHDPSESVM
jgi:hypothetical protein